jgi:hypothetical protein
MSCPKAATRPKAANTAKGCQHSEFGSLWEPNRQAAKRESVAVAAFGSLYVKVSLHTYIVRPKAANLAKGCHCHSLDGVPAWQSLQRRSPVVPTAAPAHAVGIDI